MLALLLSLAAPSAHAGDPYDNVAVGDFDGDGETDVAIGISGRCGAIEVWLAAADPSLGVPDRVSPDDITPFDPGTLWIEPETCDPLFGQQVLVERTEHGDLLTTLPDARGVGTNAIYLQTDGTSRLVVTGDAGPGCGAACESCEPCCGPAPCCNTGGGGDDSHAGWIDLLSIDWGAHKPGG